MLLSLPLLAKTWNFPGMELIVWNSVCSSAPLATSVSWKVPMVFTFQDMSLGLSPTASPFDPNPPHQSRSTVPTHRDIGPWGTVFILRSTRAMGTKSDRELGSAWPWARDSTRAKDGNCSELGIMEPRYTRQTLSMSSLSRFRLALRRLSGPNFVPFPGRHHST